MIDNLLLQLAGYAVLAVLAFEVFVTTLTTRGSGPVTGLLARALWRRLRRLRRRERGPDLLAYAGGAIASLTLAGWIMALWVGWGLVFAGAPGAIIDAGTSAPADLAARVYFAGFNLVTLGIGDYRPVGAEWQLITVMASASGLVAITLAISYLLPVLSQAVSRQALAGQIGLLGRTPEQVARNAWTEGPDSFGQRLSSLTPDLLRQGRQHLAYPILHYFHTGDPRLALPLRLAVLHEGLLLIVYGVQRDGGAPAAHRALLEAIGLFLDSIEEDVLSRASDPPAPPNLAALAAAGAPVVSAATFRASLQDNDRARRLLCGFVEHDGWGWRDVLGRDR